MSAPNRQRISPVASVCLRVVKGWLRVVSRGKGGELRNGVPYTRLKASEVKEQLEREEGVEVSTKTVQRALTELVAGGHLSRRQLYKHRYNRTYWYSPGEQEQQAQRHRPKVVAATYATQSKQQGQPVPIEGSPVSLQSLKAQITYSPLKTEGKPANQQPSTGEVVSEAPEAPQEAVIKAWGKRRPTAPTPPPVGHGGRLQQAQQALHTAIQRATARVFGKATCNSTPVAPVEARYTAESASLAGFMS